MDTLFLVCAGLGGTLIVLQFLAGAFGIGGDHAGDHDTGGDHGGADHDSHDGNWFLGLLTFRAIAAAVTFFGLGGLTALYYDVDSTRALAIAAAAAFGALYLVGTTMKLLYRLKADGTVRVDRAVGRTGTVYLRVPGNRSGPGKVTVNLQNRTVEMEAFSAGEELATGTPVQIVAVLGPSVVEVVPVPSEA